MPVISGGARGVDQTAMNAALGAGGKVIGVLAENLLKKSLERTARNAIADKRLLLLSPYHPTARFTVATAMARNKLIYAMADYGVVVQSDYKKGGTWAGAAEELFEALLINPNNLF
jgi:predicted Rossmann fold nucleotide-binding protein DprA/Smf involved in DNA uptake